MEKDETPEESIRREVREETGSTISDFCHTPFSRTFSFTFEGRDYRQHETYFVARVKTFLPIPLAFTPLEQRSIVGYRWWTRAALRSTRETIHPSLLADWFEYLLAKPY